jgi:formate-dependent phosphoribosylglycinamide formyltransferase (GAR transformylase)
MIRMFALAGAIAASSLPALAQQRGYPTCVQARSTVASQGAVVLRTAPHVYDRYVANASFCQIGEYAKRAIVETKDNSACFVGYVCVLGNPLAD